MSAKDANSVDLAELPIYPPMKVGHQVQRLVVPYDICVLSDLRPVAASSAILL